MNQKIDFEFLADHPDLIPVIEGHWKIVWGDYYGSEGPGDAREDLIALCNKARLPIGMVAKRSKTFLGSVALRSKTASHPHLGPWVTSLLVVPKFRRKGIGSRLVQEIERFTSKAGFDTLYARSATAIDFFQRNHWEAFDEVEKEGLIIFRKRIIHHSE